MIQVEKVSFTYNADTDKPVTALHAVGLEIRPGEFLAVLGHNGSGKSTLSKLLNGLMQPTAGRILVEGLDTTNTQTIVELRQIIGMVFQNPDNQLIGTTVEDDVAFGPESIGLARELIGQRVEQALAMLGIAGVRNEAPHLLSGGQKQRVAIAGVIAMRPRYIILDEPTALLDPAGRVEVLEAITRLCREEGIGIILITHFMDEIVPADRVLVMEGGHVVLEGTPREIFSHPEKLRELRLDVPLVTQVAEGLQQRGIAVPDGLLDAKELIEHLCPSR